MSPSYRVRRVLAAVREKHADEIRELNNRLVKESERALELAGLEREPYSLAVMFDIVELWGVPLLSKGDSPPKPFGDWDSYNRARPTRKKE